MGKLDGVSKVFSEEGVLLAEAYFTDGEPNGVSKEFYPNGKLKSEQNFSMGALNGPAKYFLKVEKYILFQL